MSDETGNEYDLTHVDPFDPDIDPFDYLNPRLQRYYEIFNELPPIGGLSLSRPALVFLGVMLLFGLEVGLHPFGYLVGALVGFVVRHEIEVEVSAGLGVALLITAILAYRLRCRKRTFYGVLEIAFGVISICWASRGMFGWLTAGDGGDPQLEATTVIPAVGGLYIVVRGLTNIEDGKAMQSHLARQSRVGRAWEVLFHRSWLGIESRDA